MNNTRKFGDHISILWVLSTLPQIFLKGELTTISCHDWCVHAQKSTVMNEMLFCVDGKTHPSCWMCFPLGWEIGGFIDISGDWCVLIKNHIGTEMEGSYWLLCMKSNQWETTGTNSRPTLLGIPWNELLVSVTPLGYLWLPSLQVKSSWGVTCMCFLNPFIGAKPPLKPKLK